MDKLEIYALFVTVGVLTITGKSVRDTYAPDVVPCPITVCKPGPRTPPPPPAAAPPPCCAYGQPPAPAPCPITICKPPDDPPPVKTPGPPTESHTPSNR